MNDVLQRIAIGELQFPGTMLWEDRLAVGDKRFIRTKPIRESIDAQVVVLPDYLNSLDAIMPVVRKLRGAELHEYTMMLPGVVMNRWTKETGGVVELADARHHAETLLRVKKRWKHFT